MLFFRSKVLTTKQFMQVDVEDLPHSITIVSKEYLARKGGSISDELDSDAAQNTDSFIQSLSQYGLSQDEIGECKALLDTLPERLASKDLDVSSLPYATWDDVARLLARSVKGGKQDKTDPRDTVSAFADIQALSTILSELEKDSKDSKTSDSINFLVSIIKKPITDSDGNKTDNKPKKPTFPEKPDISIEEIQAFTTKNKPHPRILAQLPDISNVMLRTDRAIQLGHSDTGGQSEFLGTHLVVNQRKTLASVISFDEITVTAIDAHDTAIT